MKLFKIVQLVATLSLPICLIRLIDDWNTFSHLEKYYYLFCTMGAIWAFYDFIIGKHKDNAN
jgi:hypothetical protein